jgi:Reverse transcriptase (RNA-dependent DNA polymerase)
MGRAKYASLIDLKAGYHNVLFGESAKYATFTTHRGRFRWLRMPFGLSNAPAHFTWVMNDIVHGDRAQG